MNRADTAEYQLRALAEVVNAVLLEASKTDEWEDPAYSGGFTDAVTSIAQRMGLRARTTYTYP